MIPETEVTTFYAEGDYQLSDSVELYGEVLLNRRETYVNGYRQYWTYLYSGNFDFACGLGPDCGSPIARDAGWFGAQGYSPTAITDHADTSVTVDYQRYLTGLRGDFS